MRKIENIILSWDTIFAIIATVFAIIYVPSDISNDFCSSIYGTSIAVLAVIFSILFASLAVIMAFPDNEFITFIEHPSKIFSRLLHFFKITLAALFVSLLYTICIYIYCTYNKGNSDNSKPLFSIFIFLLTYSLFATAISVWVTLKLTISRASYIYKKKELLDNPENGEPGEEQNEADS